MIISSKIVAIMFKSFSDIIKRVFPMIVVHQIHHKSSGIKLMRKNEKAEGGRRMLV